MTDGLGTIGRYLVVFGAAIIVIGVLIVLVGRFPGLRIGRLPGDMYIERDGWRFYFPVMTSILLSIILSSFSGYSAGSRASTTRIEALTVATRLL